MSLLAGYSPVKDTINKRAKFFDFKVQLREQIVRGVCFSPEKKEKLKQFQKCKSPIKIRKYGQNHKYGARNIVIDKRTQVILSAGPLSFACVDLDISDKSIGSLKKVAPNQTVTIKGKVVSLYGRKKISGKNLSKQEGMIADSSDTIKVVLWESFKLYYGSHLLTQLKKERLTSLSTLPIKLINMVFILEVVEMGVVLRKWKVWKVL